MTVINTADLSFLFFSFFSLPVFLFQSDEDFGAESDWQESL